MYQFLLINSHEIGINAKLVVVVAKKVAQRGNSKDDKVQKGKEQREKRSQPMSPFIVSKHTPARPPTQPVRPLLSVLSD